MLSRSFGAFLPLIANLAFGSVSGWNGSDTFGGSGLNSCNWEVSSYKGTVTQNDALILTTADQTTFSSAAVRSQYTLIGDFDITVDYEIVRGFDVPLSPAGAVPHINATLRIQSESTHAIFFSRTKHPGGSGYSVYTPIAGQAAHNSKFEPSSAARGTLRMTRTGSTTAMHYRETANWKDFDQIDGLSEPVFVYLSADNVDATNPIQVRFTNFLILSGATSSRPFTRFDAYRSRGDFHVGGVVSDYLAGQYWGTAWRAINPLDVMKQNGFDTVRVGMLTTSSPLLKNTPTSQWSPLGWHDEFWGSREFATEILRQAAVRGFHLNVFFFLSDRAAYSGRQAAPVAWQGLSAEATAATLEAYTFDAVTDLLRSGLRVENYDIGNEIDSGITGFALGERIPFQPGVDVNRDFDWMRANVWNIESQLLKAASRGVRRADPNAKITLHVSNVITSDGNSGVVAFFQTMIKAGVDFDYAGLSLPYATYPWPLDQFTTDCWFQRLQDLLDSLEALGKPVIISEASYPNDPAGTVAHPMPEFQFSAGGQAAWLREHLRFLAGHRNVVGFDYFYPDYFREPGRPIELQTSGLFITETQPAPAILESRVSLARLTATAKPEGQAVAFTSSLAGTVPSAYRWDFGDGSSSNEASPRHTYGAPGIYNWRLTAQTSVGSVYTTGDVTVTAGRRRAVRRAR